MSYKIDIIQDKRVTAKFKPRARLLLQLGDQLIKNESIALLELVKNSYDADASKVDIYMENIDSESKGIIIVEDNGCGMSADIVENVWLEPGSDFKAKQFEKRVVSPIYKRLPIGEKGIGRFGVHKLGRVIEMTTKAADTNEIFVRINWSSFNDYKYLDDVPIEIVERGTPQIFKNNSTGTNIVISQLWNKWERGIAREVKRAITSLASPFEEESSFLPSFNIFDKPGWFDDLLDWEDIKGYSLFNFEISMEGNSIVGFDYNFTPWPTMTKLRNRNVSINDPIIETFKILKDRDESEFSLSEYRIGKVVYKGYIFDLDSFILKLGVSDKKGLKSYLRENGGVRVFRDKLRVYDYGESENDWLELDHRRFQYPTKSISNNLILGAVYLDRWDSSDLIEKTNREGFVDNQAYKAFKNAIWHSMDLIETLRMIDKRKLKEFYGPTPKSEPVMSILGETKRYVEEKIKDSEVKDQIIKYLDKIEFDYKRVSENLLKAAGAGLSMSVVVHEVEKIIYEVEKVLKAEKASERVLHLVRHLSSLVDGYSEIIRRSSQTKENLKEILDQSIFNTEFRLDSHNIKIIPKYKDRRIHEKVKIAKNLLIGTLMNIIDNSIYWLDQKGFKAIEKKELFNKKILIDISEDNEFVYIIIADNGTGFLIPTEDITEPFVSAKPGGMGLGLHIASEVMTAQEGRLIFPEKGDFEIPEEFENGATVVFSLKK
ncbi:MAG: sensor histidine kinase [Desulfitobacteriaceae bacterium]|nr:sensor histidine kinase [Desulfitobacteriaceae bacterium]